MNRPLVSIVLPTYNGSKYISESIESCLRQTYSNFELIIVNDQSTDDTASIIGQYAEKDSRVRIITNPVNQKLPLSLNAGFATAKGKYFTWTSDDNFYAPQALKTMVDVLESAPGLGLVYTDYTIINNQGNIIGERHFGDVNKSFHKWLGAGACFLYKNEVHLANKGYNPSAFLIEDYDFFVRAFINFEFHYYPSTQLYFYREHNASLTATHHHAINDLSKIFLERNLPGLERKLPDSEKALLYRKFAVYYAVSKNDKRKYFDYLARLGKFSKSLLWITVLYVAFRKTYFAVTFAITGLLKAVAESFRRSSSD